MSDSTQKEVHLKEYLDIIVSRWFIIATIVILSTVLITIKAFRMKPVYRAQGTICIYPRNSNITNVRVINPMLMGSTRNYLRTQYKLIVSNFILEKIFYRFSFHQQKIFKKIKEPIKAFAKFFSVNPVRNSYVVKVGFEWTDPILACKVVDALQKSYIQSVRKRRVGITGRGLQILYKKAEELRPKVLLYAEKLQDFMVDNNLSSLERSENNILERLKEINKVLTLVELKRINLQTKYQDILKIFSENKDMDSLPEVINNKGIFELKLKIIEARQKLIALTTGKRFGENHPEIKSAKAELRIMQERLKFELKNILLSSQSEYERALVEENRLRVEFEKQKKEVFKFNKKAIEYNILKNQYDAFERSYRMVTNRIEEVEIANAAGKKEDNIFIVDAPKVPKIPIKPRKKLMIIGAFVISFFIGVGMCFFLEYFDTTIKTKEEIEKLFGLQTLGFLPFADNIEAEEIVIHKKRSPAAEAFRSIRTTLNFSSHQGKLVWISSPSPGDGKSFTALNLASVIANNGKKTLLIDCDLRKSRLHKVFKVKANPGFVNFILDKDLEIDTIIHKTSVNNLHILTSGPHPPNPSELLETNAVDEAIAELKEKYDYVIFDTPPISVVSDAIILNKYLDMGIIVVKSFVTQKNAAQRAIDVLKNAKEKVAGIIINNAEVPKSRYYYGNYYYYSHYYGTSND